jgi:hypothetical protein
VKTLFYHRRELLKAARHAASLSNYRIAHLGCRYVVLRVLKNGDERKERVFPDEEQALEYLFNMLPAIESEM